MFLKNLGFCCRIARRADCGKLLLALTIDKRRFKSILHLQSVELDTGKEVALLKISLCNCKISLHLKTSNWLKKYAAQQAAFQQTREKEPVTKIRVESSKFKIQSLKYKDGVELATNWCTTQEANSYRSDIPKPITQERHERLRTTDIGSEKNQ
uniref:Uncharacterized protein n=1 Tax=Glossina pallidipes TaxID=7398 RepID=A0A1B0A4M5_GLOPL